MINLYEYVAPQETIVPEYSLKLTPLNLSNKVYTTIDEFIDSKAKDLILQRVKEWFEKNPNRRNIKSITIANCYFVLNNGEDKLLGEVINEIRRIGVNGVSGEFDVFDEKHLGWAIGQFIGSANITFSTATYKQFKEGNFKYDKSYKGDCVVKFQKTTYGNGYNELPADDMNIIRTKLYDCMEDTTCEIIASPTRSNGPDIPKFTVYLKAVFNKNKLKSLLNELKSDRRLQNYAERLENIDRGIRAYYASKKSGDYTGD